MNYNLKLLAIFTLISITISEFLQYEQTIDYDMYVLSIQWGHTLCATSNECKEKIKQIPKNIFTLHGLWPSYSDGRRVDDCNKGNKIDVKISEKNLIDEMPTYWISYTSSNEVFWNHEYNKHGYCYAEKYGISDPQLFFDFSMSIFNKHKFDQLMINALGDLDSHHNEEVFNYDQLETLFKKVYSDMYFDLDCKRIDGKNYLAEVRFFMNLDMRPMNHSIVSNCQKSEPIYIGYN